MLLKVLDKGTQYNANKDAICRGITPRVIIISQFVLFCQVLIGLK